MSIDYETHKNKTVRDAFAAGYSTGYSHGKDAVAAPQDQREWHVADGLLYTLKDGANFDEIHVTRVGGSLDQAKRHEAAIRLRAALSSPPVTANWEQAFEMLQRLLDDEEGIGSYTQLDDDLRDEIKAMLSAAPLPSKEPK